MPSWWWKPGGSRGVRDHLHNVYGCIDPCVPDRHQTVAALHCSRMERGASGKEWRWLGWSRSFLPNRQRSAGYGWRGDGVQVYIWHLLCWCSKTFVYSCLLLIDCLTNTLSKHCIVMMILVQVFLFNDNIVVDQTKKKKKTRWSDPLFWVAEYEVKLNCQYSEWMMEEDFMLINYWELTRLIISV